MICEKLPETKEEIIAQLAQNKVVGLRDTALFMTGVAKQGCWNEQLVTKEYMVSIQPMIIEILDELKAQQ